MKETKENMMNKTMIMIVVLLSSPRKTTTKVRNTSKMIKTTKIMKQAKKIKMIIFRSSK